MTDLNILNKMISIEDELTIIKEKLSVISTFQESYRNSLIDVRKFMYVEQYGMDLVDCSKQIMEAFSEIKAASRSFNEMKNIVYAMKNYMTLPKILEEQAELFDSAISEIEERLEALQKIKSFEFKGEGK